MSHPYKALLQKEWIKLRYILCIAPALVLYAMADTYFTLNTIQRAHEAFGLWTTLISKEPPLFSAFQYIVFSGFLIGFYQIWPETQGKHVRLLFHMPMQPARIITFMLCTGLFLITCINITAALALILVFQAFYLPWEVISSVLYAFAPSAILNYVSYVTVFAFCASKKWELKGLTILSCIIFYTLLWGIEGYNLWREALHWYALLACGTVFLCYFTFLQVMGEPEKDRLYSVSRMGSLVLFALLCALILPNQYWRIYMPKTAAQRLYYSPVHEQFVRDQTVFDIHATPPNKSVSTLENGTELEGQELALALPTMNGENLLKWNLFPKEINGKQLSLQQIKYHWQYMSLSPRTIIAPPLLLEMMFEANPKGAALEAPTDVFRIAHDKNSIEFLRPETGQVDVEKSAAFTQALQDKGFVFPIMAYGGNPNLQKLYDAGYVLADAKGHIFQLQMVDAKPRAARVQGAISEKVRYIMVKEERRMEFFAYVITDTHIYAVKHRPLSLVTLPLPDYSLEDGHFYMWLDPLQKTFVQGSYNNREQGLTGRAYSPDLTLQREHSLPMLESDVQNMQFHTNVAAALFPWRILLRNPKSTYYTFEVQPTKNIFLSIMTNLLCMALLWYSMRAKAKRRFDFIFVGIFGPTALLILGIEKSATWFEYIKRRMQQEQA